MLKNAVKGFVSDILGFRILNGEYLPIGLEAESDIRHKLKIDPKIIFDVGANIGQTAIKFSKAFSSAKIYSFEPVDGSFRQLEQNIHGIANTKAFHFALGNKNEQQEIKIFSDERSVLNSLLDNSDIQEQGARSETISIRRADDFCEEHQIPYIDLLKIDTEGYELEVLRGAENMLSAKKIKLIYCETGFSPHNKHKVYFPEILEYLVGKGYILFSFYEMGTYENIDKKMPGGSQYGNALFFLP